MIKGPDKMLLSCCDFKAKCFHLSLKILSPELCFANQRSIDYGLLRTQDLWGLLLVSWLVKTSKDHDDNHYNKTKRDPVIGNIFPLKRRIGECELFCYVYT